MSGSALEDQLDAGYADAWRPDPGEKIVGRIVAMDERRGNFGFYPIVTVRNSAGDTAIHAIHTALAAKLAEAGVKIGDELGVKYEGKREGGQTGHYHAYKVAVEHAEGNGGLDWSRYSDDAVEPAPAQQELAPGQSEVHAPLEQPVVPASKPDDDIPF